MTDARTHVSSLKQEAAEQKEKLADKQAKAAAALDQISETMKNANVHKGEMEKLKEQTVKESQMIQIR